MVDHSLDIILVGNVHLDGQGLVFGVCGILPALLCVILSTLLVEIRKRDGLGTGFGQRNCCFSDDASSSLGFGC